MFFFLITKNIDNFWSEKPHEILRLDLFLHEFNLYYSMVGYYTNGCQQYEIGGTISPNILNKLNDTSTIIKIHHNLDNIMYIYYNFFLSNCCSIVPVENTRETLDKLLKKETRLFNF
jgi:hypothetical protein